MTVLLIMCIGPVVYLCKVLDRLGRIDDVLFSRLEGLGDTVGLGFGLGCVLAGNVGNEQEKPVRPTVHPRLSYQR